MPCVFCGEIHPSVLNRTMRMCANCRQSADPRRKHIVCPACGHWAPRNNHHVDGQAVSNITTLICLNCHLKLQSYLRINYAPSNPITSLLYSTHRRAAQKEERRGRWRLEPSNMARRNPG